MHSEENEIIHEETQTLAEAETETLQIDTEPSEDEAALQIELPDGEATETSLESSSETSAETSSEKSSTSSLFAEFEGEYAKISHPEEKLRFCVSFMQKSLSQHKTPSFKTFWDVRKICMELFKEEKIAPTLRTQFWTEFTHLTDEARRLKNILDAESAFHMEQIDKAISKLEEDLAQVLKLAEESEEVSLPSLGDNFQGDIDKYCLEQKQLNVLNRFAVQINAMRKELIQVEMRVRHKNKFFQRLSKAGDAVFPQRKELIKELSRRFVQDVDQFIEKQFRTKISLPFYVLREAIKSLQNMAKILTLNTKAFTDTRKKLSECWDKIRLLEKEKKQELVEKKTQFQESALKIQEQIDTLKRDIQEPGLLPDQILKRVDEISGFMRREILGREEVFALKKELNGVRSQAQGILDGEREKRQNEERAKETQRQQKLEELSQGIQQLLSEGKTWAVAEIESRKKQLLEEIDAVGKSPAEKRKLKLQLEPVRDLVAERKEEALLSLSSDQRVNLDNLRQVLEDRLARREEIKTQFEESRKAAGASGLDFVQAMDARDRLEEARERLAKIDESIEEIEEKINDLAGK